MIVKDEEKLLSNFLNSVKDYVDEIITPLEDLPRFMTSSGVMISLKRGIFQ